MQPKDAAIGLMIANKRPTRGMVGAAAQSGNFVHALTGQRYQRFQIITVAELVDGVRPSIPTPYMPYLQAEKFLYRPTPIPNRVAVRWAQKRQSSPRFATF